MFRYRGVCSVPAIRSLPILGHALRRSASKTGAMYADADQNVPFSRLIQKAGRTHNLTEVTVT